MPLTLYAARFAGLAVATAASATANSRACAPPTVPRTTGRSFSKAAPSSS
ncbi:hypothetical protein ABCR94_12515 [Streptomyces sp. 21So2-11]